LNNSAALVVGRAFLSSRNGARAMTSAERVRLALKRAKPDRVPWCEFGIDCALADKLMGWQPGAHHIEDLEANPYTIEDGLALAQYLGLDNVFYVLRPTVYAEKYATSDGLLFYGDGQIKCEADLSKVHLPDPRDLQLYEEAGRFAKGKGEYAACLVTRAGLSAVMLGMGIECFSISLYDNLAFVRRLLDIYFEWACEVLEHVRGIGFDVLVTTDDMAFKTAPYFSPQIFHEICMPYYRELAKHVSLPWVIHSDGNIMPFLEDLATLGISGVHPCEKGAMDIRSVKNDYGNRLCVLGNVDVDLLAQGNVEQTRGEVRGLLKDLAPGGGYIITSGNSLAHYFKPENVLAFASEVRAQAET
jgi:uroporphyrinogen decarboxylase